MNAREQQAALDRARAGDADALGALLESFRPYAAYLLRALHSARLRPRLDASDLVQDVMLAARRGFVRFEGEDVARFAAWLRRVVVRTVARAFRTHVEADRRSLAREV